MSEPTPGTGPGPGAGGRDGWPFGPVAGGSQRPVGQGTTPPAVVPGRATTSGASTTQAGAPAGRRRPPLWVLIAIGVVVVGLAIGGALMLANRGTTEVPEAEVVTLPVPTPTVEPAAREPGTAFADALPTNVRQFVFATTAPEPALLTAGALEGYLLTYTDGGAVTLTVHAGQWATPEAATAAYQVLAAAQTALAADPATVEEAAVLVAGSEAGRSTLVPRADGTGSVTWSNGTVVLQLEGPADAIGDVYAAFSL
ncbi:MAG: hypothetical protein HGA44_11795 [Cellulomonadaceae bacterium]|nr:hypothetical protein [Cellulomonadaceae bacterium]